ncbi:MAG: MFS transporter [Candidatus Hermodarchaeota archaeon]
MVLNTNTSYNYRTWPIFLLSFIRLFYVSIFERALSNYLYLIIGIQSDTLGFISAAGAITYIGAPIVGQFLTTKYLGIRNALILNSVLTPLLTGFQILYPETWFLILSRILLGLSMGLFWPNCLNLLSKWQKVSTVEKSKKHFAFFNVSWNSGFIIGLLVGFSWAFFFSDFLAMIISWLISFLLIPISLFIKKDGKPIKINEKVIYQSEDPLSHLDIKEDLVINSETPMIIYPIKFSWLSIMFLATSKSILIFGYLFLLEYFIPLNTPSYPTYIVQGGVQFTQLIGLTVINYMGVYKRKIASLLGVGVIILVAFTIILIQNIWFISIITAFTGLFLGLIHGVGLKTMLEYGAAENTSKYSMINEILIGIGFGVTPIISGYVVKTQIFAIHGFIIIFGIFVLIGLIYLSRNIKKSRIMK